jgi:FKBP-type peptidyl-prolyl cis-trans isomerase FkpA
MKKWFLILTAFSVTAISCKKNSETDCTSAAPSTVAGSGEISNIQGYLSANSVNNAVQQPNGVFYVINPQGTGKSPNLCSNTTVRYKGYIFNSLTPFDSTATGATATFALNRLIAGWQLVLPLVKSGGSVTLFIPPSLAYGAAGQGPIPPNAYLKFNIDLVDVN